MSFWRVPCIRNAPYPQGGLAVHPNPITIFSLTRLVPRVGLPRNLFLISSLTAALRCSKGWVRKDLNLVMGIGCTPILPAPCGGEVWHGVTSGVLRGTCTNNWHRWWGATWCYIRRFVRDIFQQICNTSPPQGVLRSSLLRSTGSELPGNSPWAWEVHPFKLRFCLSQILWNTAS